MPRIEIDDGCDALEIRFFEHKPPWPRHTVEWASRRLKGHAMAIFLVILGAFLGAIFTKLLSG